MRVATLPSPGLLSNGVRIRIEAAKAISAVEINAGRGGGKARNAKDLKDFFDACSASIAGFVETVVPTFVSAVISTLNTKRVTLRFSEGLEAANTPLPAAFTLAGQVKPVTKVTIDGVFVHLDVATAFVAGAVTVAYAVPVSTDERLQDESSNYVAAISATAVTNGIV
jgi:hypothetical protein